MSGIAADRDPTGALTAAARRAVGRALSVGLDDATQAPDWITPEARRAIVTYAKGGRARLQVVLATAFFLAEKEHKGRVDLALVQRAAALQSPSPAAAPIRVVVAAEPRNGWLHWAAALLLIPTAGIVAYGWHPAWHAVQVPAGTVLLSEVALPTGRQVAFGFNALHTPGDLLVEAPPVLVALQAPSSATPSPPVAAWQPVDPPTTVRLRFDATGAAPHQAQTLAASLRAAGFAVELAPEHPTAHARPASLRFFYAEDRTAAERLTQVLNLRQTMPTQALASDHQSIEAPGTIELFLP